MARLSRKISHCARSRTGKVRASATQGKLFSGDHQPNLHQSSWLAAVVITVYLIAQPNGMVKCQRRFVVHLHLKTGAARAIGLRPFGQGGDHPTSMTSPPLPDRGYNRGIAQQTAMDHTVAKSYAISINNDFGKRSREHDRTDDLLISKTLFGCLVV